MNNCKDYAMEKKIELKTKVEELATRKKTPVLTIFQVGDNPSSNSYIKGKMSDCREVGIYTYHRVFPESVTTQELVEAITYSHRHSSGIIVQLPLPEHINLAEVHEAIYPDYDVDGFRKDSFFTPCTPRGVIDYLKYENFDFQGKVACVIGRSDIVGKPLRELLLAEDMTVITCHSKTPKVTMQRMIESADIVFIAINPIEYFDEDWFHALDGKHIIDIGLGLNENNKLRGNIKKEVKDQLIKDNPHRIIVSGIGGVGLLTRVTLLDAVVQAESIKIH